MALKKHAGKPIRLPVAKRRSGSTRKLKAALAVLTTASNEREKELAGLNRWLDVALNNMARGLSMFDDQQKLIVCNKTYQEIYELPDHLTKRGTSFLELARYYVLRETGRDGLREQAQREAWIENHIQQLLQGKTFTHTQHLRNGRIVLVTIKPLPDGGWVDVQEDITERCKAEQQINWLVRHDPLTEVANRIAFREALDTAIATLGRSIGFAIHWIDLDYFKQVNDTLGHPVGDALLQSIARRLIRCARGSDIVARLGGDEFVIIQAGAEGWAEAEQLAKRVLKEIARPHFISGQVVHCTATLGIALAPQHAREADELMKCADVALYSAKERGRNSFQFYEPGLVRGDGEINQLATDLKQALEKGQLDLHYQPIVNSQSQAVVAFEALMRWNHPTQGNVPPSVFIPLAEQTKLIGEIGAWALNKACQAAALWPSEVRVNVNLSPVQFELGDLPGIVTDALRRSSLESKRLELEITEGVLLRDQPAIREALHDLRTLGVRVALDDFGTGYASLTYLRTFPFNKIKIDRAFVRDIGNSQRSDAVDAIAGLSSLARHLKMRTVLEGIETMEELEAVLDAGCDELQGFYFGRPVPVSAVPSVIAECRRKMIAHTKAELGLRTA